MNTMTYIYEDSCTLRDKKQQMFWNLLYYAGRMQISRAIMLYYAGHTQLSSIMPRKYIEGRFRQITCGMQAYYREIETLRNSEEA